MALLAKNLELARELGVTITQIVLEQMPIKVKTWGVETSIPHEILYLKIIFEPNKYPYTIDILTRQEAEDGRLNLADLRELVDMRIRKSLGLLPSTTAEEKRDPAFALSELQEAEDFIAKCNQSS